MYTVLKIEKYGDTIEVYLNDHAQVRLMSNQPYSYEEESWVTVEQKVEIEKKHSTMVWKPPEESDAADGGSVAAASGGKTYRTRGTKSVKSVGMENKSAVDTTGKSTVTAKPRKKKNARDEPWKLTHRPGLGFASSLGEKRKQRGRPAKSDTTAKPVDATSGKITHGNKRSTTAGADQNLLGSAKSSRASSPQHPEAVPKDDDKKNTAKSKKAPTVVNVDDRKDPRISRKPPDEKLSTKAKQARMMSALSQGQR